MITTCPWLGISPPDWFINSDTPHSLAKRSGSATGISQASIGVPRVTPVTVNRHTDPQ
jgi:hypothetical protein